ncbi:hypothetical protein BDZ90DRAFT_279021 [Jaminaea rosea]|uniref:Eukaryotic translation initiation factor 3 subunit L n=1 Tax=Jaminaea rosea TaxID=1569628 RepID=A0A316UTQ7_9BASI|nr:hypothetical protein BDZ90DRAFT_279021 [Jaminaea rosea]PWN28680.1 hypothetical protein BDZ90DRAFT_279021 [Jaminaea rosea]
MASTNPQLQQRSGAHQPYGGEAGDTSRQYYSGQGVGSDSLSDFGEEDDLIPDFPTAAATNTATTTTSTTADEAQLHEAQQQQQQQQAAAALAAVPEQVRKYIVLFWQAVQGNNLGEISSAYEGSWNRLTEKFYQRSEWPEAEVIAPLVNNDSKFLMLYRELWFRHVYSRLSPDGEDRFSSYDSYCDFFNHVLNSDGPVALELPPQWLWDIVDEFIYQFQSYSQWRNRAGSKTEDELQLLQDGGVWSSYSVLNVLYSLIQKSRITEQLVAMQEGRDPDEVAGEFGSKPLYKMLGYFSIIGLLRVHVLLGDYTLALQMLDHLDLGKKSSSSSSSLGLINRVTACHVTAYYYVGFAYLMLGRYADAIKSFTHILVFTMRLRQYHTRSYQYDQINKTVDRMYALLAIACALCPTRLDENIQNTMRDKYGEQYARMSRGAGGAISGSGSSSSSASASDQASGTEALSAFEELFLYACPKFITSNSPPYHDAEQLEAYVRQPSMGDPAQHQLRLFLSSARAQLSNAHIRSFLRLFTTLGTDRLASFLGVDEEELTETLMLLKSSTRSPVWASGEGSLLDGPGVEVVNTSDLDFAIEGSMVHIRESRVGRRYAEWFRRNSVRMADVLGSIQGKALPIAAPVQAGEPGKTEQQQGKTGGAAAATAVNGTTGTGKPAWGAAGARTAPTAAAAAAQ